MIYSTQEISRKTEFTPRTLRYYEEIGVLRKMERDRNRHRQYTEEDLYLLKLIKRARKFLGLSLSEIKELVTSLRQDPTEKILIIGSISVLQNHIKKIEIQKKELKKAKSLLFKEIKRLQSLLEEMEN